MAQQPPSKAEAQLVEWAKDLLRRLGLDPEDVGAQREAAEVLQQAREGGKKGAWSAGHEQGWKDNDADRKLVGRFDRK